jgi:predicted nucleotidyltransferase
MTEMTTIARMMPPQQRNAINHVMKKFIVNPYVDTVFLFGSCAKGTATENSDIDMFIVTKESINDDSHEAFHLLYGAADDLPLDDYVSCDVLTATREEFDLNMTPLARVIKREGVQLNGIL